jgi:hypothetical protein
VGIWTLARSAALAVKLCPVASDGGLTLWLKKQAQGHLPDQRMLITVISIVWLAVVTLLVCACRTAAAADAAGAVRDAPHGSIGERLVLERTRAAHASYVRRPFGCRPSPRTRRPAPPRQRSAAHRVES